jgi:hypothetical protein
MSIYAQHVFRRRRGSRQRTSIDLRVNVQRRSPGVWNASWLSLKRRRDKGSRGELRLVGKVSLVGLWVEHVRHYALVSIAKVDIDWLRAVPVDLGNDSV